MTHAESRVPAGPCAKVQEALAEFVLGILDSGEHARVQDHLEGCAPCSARRHGVAAELVPLFDVLRIRIGGGAADSPCRLDDSTQQMAAPNLASDKALRDERRTALWDRIDCTLDEELRASDGLIEALVRSALPPGASYTSRLQGPWTELGVPGVRAKILHMDRSADRRVALIQMDPGRTFPAHEHAADEECFVIRGDLAAADVELRAGDYRRMAAGTEHGEQTTRNGCLVLLIGSCHDAA